MKSQVHFAVLLAALITVTLLADAWRSARRDSQQLSTVLTSQNAQIQNANEREKQQGAELATVLAEIGAQKHSVQTPLQAAKQLPQALPPLPLPVSIQIPNLSAAPAGQLVSSENAPEATIRIPKPDLIPLYDELQDCRADRAEASALQQDLADEKDRSAALRRQRDAALTAARGGTALARLKRAAKWFAIGMAAGAAIAASARH